MKKTYKQFRGFMAACGIVALSTASFAQLNGVYTINSAQGTSGTNFNNFTDFATAFNAQGVSAPVTVNVVANSGPYVQQVTLTAPAGLSSVNRVTINGNNNLLTYNSTNFSQPWTLGLNSTDWIKINNLQIQGTGTSYAVPLALWGGADNNMFTACTFSCPLNSQSSSQIPVQISGSGANYYTSSNAGSNNTWQSCDMYGGYFNVTLYGPSSAPFNSGNKFLNNLMREFYYYGFFSNYQDQVTLRQNTIERPTLPNPSTYGYAIYFYYTTGTQIDGNKIRRMYDMAQTGNGSFYCIMFQGNSNTAYSGGDNDIVNNIISDFKWNGTIYGVQTYYQKGKIMHNTISFDHTASTASGSLYGIYPYSLSGFTSDIRNNMISMTRGGSGAKYGIYYNGTGLTTSNNNNFWLTGSNAYAANYNGNQASLASYQSASSMEANSYSINPNFVSVLLDDLHPTNTLLNNLGAPIGVVFDQENKVRNQTTPDIGALEFLTPLCTGLPGANSITGPNYSLCPGEVADLGLLNWPSDAGLTYQWQVSSTSNVGPFTPISGQNGLFYTTPPVNQTTYYSVVITCTAAGNASIAPVISLFVAGPTQGTVPYYEGFETVGKANRLPNCSWAASSLGDRNQTYATSANNNRVPRNGTSFAAFSNQNTGTSYFYTHPIQMNSGITYSAAVHWATEYFGYSNWTNLSILVGPNQSTVGLVQVASKSPAISGPYKLLDNTFTVPTSGLYYVAIKATSTSGNATYLMIDDLSVTIPCDLGSPNNPTVSVAASTSTICQNDPPVSLTATGADTYSWSTGDQTSQILQSPMMTTNFYVYGTNALTGCTSTMVSQIVVNPTPTVFVVASNPNVCAGQPVTLSAFGADNFIWNPSGQGQNITVVPTANTSYTVSGTWNNSSCAGKYVQNITVKPSPSVQVSSSADNACLEDQLTLSAFAPTGVSYQWYSSNSPIVYQGNPININANTLGVSSSVFTVIVVGQNGCTGQSILPQEVHVCTGLDNLSGVSGVRIYPNPTASEFNVEFTTTSEKTVQVTDVTGRVITSKVTSEQVVPVSLSNLANGIYYVKVQTENSVKVVKVVKQ